MKLRVTARNWDYQLEAFFGKKGSEYDFPDSTHDFLKLTEPFGRFEYTSGGNHNPPTIKFDNIYD